MTTHSSRFRVYYEDTDMAGIVYYANYLKFMERGRSDAVRRMGVDQAALMREAGIVFAVRHVDLSLESPARLDDELEVTTRIVKAGGASLVMEQEIHVGERRIAAARIRIAVMTPAGEVARLPAALRQRFAGEATAAG